MSAPDTNLDRQKKRHAGPLIGIGAGIVFAIILLVVYMSNVAGEPGEGEADVVESPSVSAPATETPVNQ
ncbi:DUF2273 domain-containing protein [Jannaschia pohangensis]|uniref:Uncharacterized protein n=1 Tax=Jannaschia pohangensis TaxID=390807 RepID=A0A1I3HWQ2_9RHOB|nr:DUF2273 domain-containing protein [Jannaschia pohangensis]SFI40176.1 hypothetical protein SAMN04488095_0734 [Jannaschia pohangensis]